MFTRKNNILLILFICFIVSGLVANYFAGISSSPESENKSQAVHQSFTQQVVKRDSKIIFGNLYSLCQHLIEQKVPIDIYGLNVNELLRRYSPDEGWVVDNLNSNRIVIYQKVEGLCPEDALKRHLGSKGDYVAVFRGPIGINGGLERLTTIRLEKLPQQFKEKLIKGELDFSNENELMDALDTIDEYEQ